MRACLYLLLVFPYLLSFSQKKDLFDEIKERGILRVGVNDEADPFGYRHNNQIQGIDIDLAKEVAKSLEVKLELVAIQGAAYRESYLHEDKTKRRKVRGDFLDLIIAIYSPNSDRDVDFTIPYFATDDYFEQGAGLGMIVKKSSDILKPSDLFEICPTFSGKCVSYVKNTNSAKYFKNFFDTENTQGIDEEKQAEVWKRFLNGEVLAIIDDISLIKKAVDHYPELVRYIQLNNSNDKYCIGLPKGNPRMKSHLNDVIHKLVSTDDNGASFLEKTFDYHMGFPSLILVNSSDFFLVAAVFIVALLIAVLVIVFLPKKANTNSDKEDILPKESIVSETSKIGVSYAWLIGNDEYYYHKDLSYSIKNVEEFSEILKKNYQFKSDNIKITKNAKRDDILNGFGELNGEEGDTIEFSKRIRQDDSLIIYYSGHGYYHSDKGSWIPTDIERRNEYIRNSTIKEELASLSSKLKHILLISDCCFSGALIASPTKSAQVSLSNLKKSVSVYHPKKSVQVITSGSKEEVPDDSVFASKLNELLQQQTLPIITSLNLFSDLEKEILQTTEDVPKPQYGTLKEALNEGGQFLFIKKEAFKNLMNESEIERSISSLFDELHEAFLNLEQISDQLNLDRKEVYNILQGMETKDMLITYFDDDSATKQWKKKTK